MSDDPPPPIEWAPPYSLDFVAHLDGGCYADEVTNLLLIQVRADPSGRHMLDALTLIRLGLSITPSEVRLGLDRPFSGRHGATSRRRYLPLTGLLRQLPWAGR